MITLDKFISNLNNLNAQTLEKEVLDLFEPIVFQYVLYTRPDTGQARKSLGLRFGQMVKSDRIIKATEYDLEVNHAMYNFWNYHEDDEWSGTCSKLMTKGLLKISIVTDDYGLYNQAVNGALPSENHLTRLDNTPDRMPPHHINVVNDSLSISDLENITNANIIYIANDMKQRVKALVEKIKMEMFK